MRDARRALGPALASAGTAVAAEPAAVTAYRQALDALQRAATPLEVEQQRALTGVVAAGEDEAGRADELAVVAADALPVFAAVDAAQATWLDRAGDGWFRTRAEAAGAYAVLLRPQEGALLGVRAALRDADEGRRAALQRQRAALAAADAALAPLRLPG